MHIAKHSLYVALVPLLILALSVASLALWGLKPGIDLSGGSLVQVTYVSTRPDPAAVSELVKPLGLGEVRVQPSGTDGFLLRLRDISPQEKNALLSVLATLGPIHEDLFTSVSPTIGAELLRKAWIAVGLVVVSIIAFIAFAFRGVSRPVASWKYGVVAMLTLLHDIVVPMGLFAFLGHVAGAEVDSLFIVALLTILGISINDTIVVFDRIRENLRALGGHIGRQAFGDVVHTSVRQTIARSINTSVTTIIVLVALLLLGPEATKNFALTLIVGMVAGTYSSILLAAPMLVWWNAFSHRKQ